MSFDEDLQILLCKVNKVTSYHRHGQKIPVRALDDLSNYQIDFENMLKDRTSDAIVDNAKKPIIEIGG